MFQTDTDSLNSGCDCDVRHAMILFGKPTKQKIEFAFEQSAEMWEDCPGIVLNRDELRFVVSELSLDNTPDKERQLKLIDENFREQHLNRPENEFIFVEEFVDNMIVRHIRHKAHNLMIIDDAIDRRLLRRELERAGYVVHFRIFEDNDVNKFFYLHNIRVIGDPMINQFF